MVTSEGQILGYVEDKSKFEEKITSEIKEYTGKNIESVSLNDAPNYELKLLNRTENTNEEEIIIALQENTTITYKYYEIALNDEQKACVNTQEEAENIVEQLKQENPDDEIVLNFEISEKTTQNLEEINTESADVIIASLAPEIEEQIKEIEEEKSAPSVNGIRLAVTPVSGTISSRFGVSSRIRSSTHTGLDIACASGTDIKVVADGTVTSVTSGGSYGNLLKVSHGNGVETWYAHCSKIYAKEGQAVNAGEVVAAVGSTGNSTGPHLHLEIRIDGTAVNPQNYLYK